MLEIRNRKFWEGLPYFIKKDIELPTLGIRIIGYFPYHTASVLPGKTNPVIIPRAFFSDFDNLLTLNGIGDNKAVYICEILDYHAGADNFAIMLKDDWGVTSSWENVVNYNHSTMSH